MKSLQRRLNKFIYRKQIRQHVPIKKHSLCVWHSEVNKGTSPFGWFYERVIIEVRRLKGRDTTAQGPVRKSKKRAPSEAEPTERSD